MSGSRHTPGPWRFNPNWDGEAVITTDAGEPVLQQVAPDAMRGGVDALDEDLQLMAAAPELLEALKNALGVLFEEDLGNRWGHVIDPISSLIARAEGRET